MRHCHYILKFLVVSGHSWSIKGRQVIIFTLQPQLLQSLPWDDLLARCQLLRWIELTRFSSLELKRSMCKSLCVFVGWGWLQLHQLPLFYYKDLIWSRCSHTCPQLMLLSTNLSYVLVAIKIRLLKRWWRQCLHDLIDLIDSIQLLAPTNYDPIWRWFPLYFLITWTLRSDTYSLLTPINCLLD